MIKIETIAPDLACELCRKITPEIIDLNVLPHYRKMGVCSLLLDTNNYAPTIPGNSYPLDDDLVLWFTKKLS